MNEGWKKWLIKSAGFGAGFALMLAAVLGGGIWYVSRPKPPKPWNRAAIRAEFLGPAASNEKGVINLWYTLTNTTAADYKIAGLSEITTAGWTREDDALYGFKQGISVDLPLIIPAHRKAKAILHIALVDPSVAGGASDAQASRESVKAFLSLDEAGERRALGKMSLQAKKALLEGLRARTESDGEAVTTHKAYAMNFLQSEYPGLNGFALMDERNRFEIDFPLLEPSVQEKEKSPVRLEAKP